MSRLGLMRGFAVFMAAQGSGKNIDIHVPADRQETSRMGRKGRHFMREVYAFLSTLPKTFFSRSVTRAAGLVRILLSSRATSLKSPEIAFSVT
jgi:hypothetical protein